LIVDGPEKTTDGQGFYRSEQSQRRGSKMATTMARQNPIETAELPQKDTKNSKAFGRNIYGRKIERVTDET
jgi:hypothetical protein